MKRPSVFLSSTFKDDLGLGLLELPLRRRILESADVSPVDLWAYEHVWGGEVADTHGPDVDTIIDRCFAGIKGCDLFVFIVTGRHGTGARFMENNISASYLELELFAAAVLKKPILILHYRNREPEPALFDAMSVLRRAFASSAYIIDDESALFDHFQNACRALANSSASPGDRQAIVTLPEGLSFRRSMRRMQIDLTDSPLIFLNGQMRAGKSSINPDNAQALIDQVARGVRDVGGEQRIMPHGVALFRLWAAMRELMDDSGKTMTDPLVAPLWDRAMGLWASKASWFGLHGHVWMGPLAAVHAQIEIRKRLAGEPMFHIASDVREPLGARASAIYSIAQRMHTRRRKLFHFRQVVELTSQAIERDPKGQQGALSIRAHAMMHMGQLGHVWKLWDALADFKRLLAVRESTGVSEASVGEVKADLGFCLVITGRPRRGLALVQEGVSQLRADNAANGKAFLARGLRKQLWVAKFLRNRNLAEATRHELDIIAMEIEAIDQLRDN